MDHHPDPQGRLAGAAADVFGNQHPVAHHLAMYGPPLLAQQAMDHLTGTDPAQARMVPFRPEVLTGGDAATATQIAIRQQNLSSVEAVMTRADLEPEPEPTR